MLTQLVLQCFADEQSLISGGESLVNCPPSKPLLPPKKSNRRGRPKKIAFKSKIDVAIKNIIKKQKNRK
jgi:hypothetical protein